MYMTNKRFIRTVCPIIALLFFFATITPSVVQAQVNDKIGGATSTYMLKLATAGKNERAALTEEQRLAMKEKILIRVEKLLNSIKQSDFSEETVREYGYILPQGFTEKIMLMSDIAKADMPTEAKVHALVGAFGYDCDEIIYVAAVIYVLAYFDVIPYLGYFGNVLFALAALCYYGLI